MRVDIWDDNILEILSIPALPVRYIIFWLEFLTSSAA